MARKRHSLFVSIVLSLAVVSAGCGSTKATVDSGATQTLQAAAHATLNSKSFVMTSELNAVTSAITTYVAPNKVSVVEINGSQRSEIRVVGDQVFASDPADPSKFVVTQSSNAQDAMAKALQVPTGISTATVTSQADGLFQYVGHLGANAHVTGTAQIQDGRLHDVYANNAGTKSNFIFSSYDSAPDITVPSKVEAAPSNVPLPQ